MRYTSITLAASAILALSICCGIPAKAQSVQDGYVDGLRGQLQQSARYPTGREASQRRDKGEVTLRFVLARDGSLRDVQIVKSSDSMLLDGAAMTAVRRAAYPTFAPGLFAGQAGHDFQVTLAYAPAGEGSPAATPYYAQASVQALGHTAKP